MYITPPPHCYSHTLKLSTHYILNSNQPSQSNIELNYVRNVFNVEKMYTIETFQTVNLSIHMQYDIYMTVY